MALTQWEGVASVAAQEETLNMQGGNMNKFFGLIVAFCVTAAAAFAQAPADTKGGQPEIIKTRMGAEIPEQPELEPHWGAWIKKHWPRWRENYWIDRGPWPGANQGIIYRKGEPSKPAVEVGGAPPENLTPITPEGRPQEQLIPIPAPPVTSRTPTNYTVKKGDSLWIISSKMYGSPLKWPVIFRANSAKIKNPNRIYPGQVLEIPPLN
jgi:nucleoid-associated protein YgaU